MTKNKEQIIEEVDDYNFDDDFTDEDYGFILGPNGELKSIMFPEDLMENPPPKISKILKILGVTNIHQLEPRNLH